MRLRPFFSYYGSKWLLGPHYPAPLHETVVEPFAGSAGYALAHHARRVVLVDSDPVVAGLWRYLIDVRASEIRALPAPVESIDEIPGPQEARWLVGFWLGRATSSPRRTLSKWGRDGRWPMCFWGERIRDRIAAQVEYIRHWTVVHGAYTAAPDGEATWFVDPPYERQGRYYRSEAIDYGELATWCRSRPGQVIACENDGASWLPFEPWRIARANSSRSNGRVSRESMWTAAPPASTPPGPGTPGGGR